jgi:hypothetical protein
MESLKDHPAMSPSMPVELCWIEIIEVNPTHMHLTFVGTAQTRD